jgi:hypothetical protein
MGYVHAVFFNYGYGSHNVEGSRVKDVASWLAGIHLSIRAALERAIERPFGRRDTFTASRRVGGLSCLVGMYQRLNKQPLMLRKNQTSSSDSVKEPTQLAS